MLKFFVTKTSWGEAVEVPFREYHRAIHTRADFKHFYPNGVVINGVKFDTTTVCAERKKKNTIIESVISTGSTLLLLFIFGHNITPAKYWIGGGISWAFGLLFGRLRIESQQKRADEFNKSPVA